MVFCTYSYLESALLSGVKPQVLAFGMPYHTNIDKVLNHPCSRTSCLHVRDLTPRIPRQYAFPQHRYLYQEIKDYPPDDIVTFTDADVIFQRGAEAILTEYESHYAPGVALASNCEPCCLGRSGRGAVQQVDLLAASHACRVVTLSLSIQISNRAM
jgi:hypothetical protein